MVIAVSSPPGIITLRPYTPADTSAVLALINLERIPGQPVTTTEMLSDALEGRSAVDAGWWADLNSPSTWVAVSGPSRVVGVVSYAWRPKDRTGLLLWLHSGEEEAVTETLIDHVVTTFAPNPVEAFQFACALSLGLEALPIGHRPVTDAVLRRAGFAGERLWRYMRADLPAVNLPRLARVKESTSNGDKAAIKLESHRFWRTVTAEAEVGQPVQGIGVLWWIEVSEASRGRGLGRRMLGSALARLTDLGARQVILYVDDDAPPGGPRDRTAANSLYESAGFTEVDRLYSYKLEATQ
ncbi:GNAT family N-acetyltransferase [Streptomyces sp. NPDC093801]|uniref:GNAT family N-acetyltransferase n=1 Tax=Streptomyces sp. NPDC093801 TaxID=3155203 RepID=UPI00344E17B8